MSRFQGIRGLADQIILYGTNEADDLRATGYQRIIYGYDGEDQLEANSTGSYLYGGNGGDLLISGPGGDYLDGGNGEDSANYADSDAGVTVNLISGTGMGGWAEGDTLVDIENVFGSGQSDLLIGDNEDNILSGGRGGADQIIAGGGNDTIVSGKNPPGEQGDFLSGGSGNDNFVFGVEDDSGGGVAMDFIADFGNGDDTISFFPTGAVDNVTWSGEASNFSLFGSEIWYQHTTDATYGDVTIIHAQFLMQDNSFQYFDVMLDEHLVLQESDFLFIDG